MQIKLLHDRRDAFGADPDAAFGQSDANFFGTESLGTVIKNLLYQPHKPRLLLIALAAVGSAEDVVVEGSAGNIQRFTELVDTIRVVWLLVEAFQEGQLFL